MTKPPNIMTKPPNIMTEPPNIMTQPPKVMTSTQPAKWTDSLPDGYLKYACAGDNVHIPWNFALSAGESPVDDVQWFYQGRSSEMIAVLTHGNFLPLPSFSHRVHFIPNGGIIVDYVTVQDSGNYSVEISGHGDSGTFFRIKRTIVLQVGADLMTTDGQLHVSENPLALLDKTTDQWSKELHCGTFTYLGQPPFDVEWMTPSGNLMSSSTYKDGQFKLLVSAPVQGGNYSCRIPVLSISTACLPEGN
ncbi:uncharacterized protein [Littorina saxatilis]|uniref:uncharacterized protein n=1 Tax=Littorina saxatilis TaxID=31220 RepID=UPI0038B4AAB4